MKSIVRCCFIAALLCFTMTVSAKTFPDNKIVFQSGYGYSWRLNDGDSNKDGFSMVQSLYYMPFHRWGFGVNFGINKNRKNEWDDLWVYKYNTTFVGPSVVFFPVRIDRHDVYISAGVNYVHLNTTSLSRQYNPETDLQRHVWDSWNSNMVAPNFSVGYSYKICKGIGIGVKANGMYRYKMQISGLINLTISL